MFDNILNITNTLNQTLDLAVGKTGSQNTNSLDLKLFIKVKMIKKKI